MSDMRESAIDSLRKYQKRSRQKLGLAPRHTEQEILALTLQWADKREAQAMYKGGFIYEGALKYPEEMERLRWQRTRDVIRRVVPGMDEDPVYLELLARQAASVEIILRQELSGSPNTKSSALCDHILLGTIADLDPEAFSRPAGDCSMVVLSSGLISFLYQAAKSVVISWQPTSAESGTSYSIRPAREDVESVLSKNPYPSDLLQKTLDAYLFEGYPRAVGYDPPPPEYQPFLAMLVNLSERFIIAHEYGHALLHQLASAGVLPAERTSWPKEFEADSFAFFFNAMSGWEIDHFPANIALQGGFFVFAVLEVLRKALCIVRHGEVEKDMGTESHPPTQQRIELLKNMYLREVGIDVKYNLPAVNQAGHDKTIDLAIQGALIPADTLGLLWGRIEHRYQQAHSQGEKLHPIWI
jgi:hypothetical protein